MNGKTVVFFGFETLQKIDRPTLLAKLYETFLKRASREDRMQVPERGMLFDSIGIRIIDHIKTGGSFVACEETIREVEPGESLHANPARLTTCDRVLTLHSVARHLPGSMLFSPPRFMVIAGSGFVDPADERPEIPEYFRKVVRDLSDREHAVIAMVRNGRSRVLATDLLYGRGEREARCKLKGKLDFLQAEKLSKLPAESFFLG